MFTIDSAIDTVKNGTITMADAIQKGKKQIVKTFVTNESYADTMNDFVDAQTEYTNRAITAGFDSVKNMLNITVDYFNDSLKYTQPIKAKSSK